MESMPKVFDKEDVIDLIEIFKEKTKKETISIQLNTDKVKVTESKFGGVPYLPRDKEVPSNQNNEQYRLLAQIRLDNLPKNNIGLPTTGMLQFWILDDNMMGLETNYQVIYYPTIDNTITSEDIDKKYNVQSHLESYFPIQDEFGLTFELKEQAMTIADYQFDKTFIEMWNQVHSNQLIETYEDLGEQYTDILYDSVDGGGHRIGGYPYFTQYDPREYDMQDYQILLLQIDTDSIDGKDIMWGDCGVANFFITANDLKNLDFTKVFYTWDCC